MDRIGSRSSARRLFLGVLVLAALPSYGRAQASPPSQASEQKSADQQPIRVSVDRVNIGVSVTDPTGKFVEGLRRENFQVFDNGVEQPITDFLAIEEPAQTVLLVESGPAVYLLQGVHLQAARAFLAGLSPDDRVAVVKYDASPQLLLDFTTDKNSVTVAFDGLSFNLGFGSLNLSASLAKVLDSLGSTPGKKTIVLLSTGVDTSGPAEIQALLRRLATSDVRILAVSLSGNLRNPEPGGKKKTPPSKAALAAQQFAEADELLRQISERTGGQAFFPSTTQELAAAFAQVAQVVRHEFSLAFAPPFADGKVHSLEVRVKPDGVAAPSSSTFRVAYRRAYLAPTAATP